MMIKGIMKIGMQSFLLIFFSMAILLGSLQGIDKITKRQVVDQSLAIEDVLIKASIQCYALEGSYPPNLYYLRDHYGTILNEEKYFYFYAVEGANLLPNIVVIKR